MTSFDLNLGGYSQVSNKIKDAGASAISNALSHLSNLETIVIDFGHTCIKD